MQIDLAGASALETRISCQRKRANFGVAFGAFSDKNQKTPKKQCYELSWQKKSVRAMRTSAQLIHM